MTRQPVYIWGQHEPAAWLPLEEELQAAEDAARLVQLGEGFRWPDELEHPGD